MNIKIVTVLEDAKSFEEFLHNEIKSFNNRNSPMHNAARQPGKIKPLNLILQTETGEPVGGLAASTYWDWLEIDNFYVPAALRGQGIGTKLLQQAEEIAQLRGCKHCFLSTYEFQARRFYEMHGYSIVGELLDYPAGSAFYWMRKELVINDND